MAAALLAFAAPAANAQRVNTNSELKKLEKADATLLDVKKNTKAATWNAHGKAYTDAYMLPTKELAQNIPMVTLQMNVGEPQDMFQSEFQGQPVFVARYEYVDVYIDQTGIILGWSQSKAVKENLAETAIESYKKAYELDNKLGSKISDNTVTLAQALAEQGRALNGVGRYAEAANNFELAHRARQVVPTTTIDPSLIYNAGYINVLVASTATEGQVELYAKAEAQLKEAIEVGYKDEGMIYYYLFYCYYGQREDDKQNLIKAKETLLEGIEKFPKSERILDGLMSLYTAEEGVGDPAELVDMIDKFLAETPNNPDLWFGRGRVFYKLKNFDECIVSFKKIDELKPNDFDTNYYIGHFYIEKGDYENSEFNKKLDSFTSQDEYMVERKRVRSVYMEAIPYLEKAHSLNPENVDCAQLLKSVCFLLRDEPGVMDKYNQYNAVYKKLKGLE